MRNFKFIIEYDGRNFSGWQIQEKNKRTVQGEITNALKRITGKPVTLIGAGRTDSGVHALGQAAHAHLDTPHGPEVLLKALNANLPDDISILKVTHAPLTFHAQFSAKHKTYRYTILNRQARSSKERGFYTHIPQKLNILLMKTEAKILVGNHDFSAFTATDSNLTKKGIKKSAVRKITKISFASSHGFFHIDIQANGFLYKMVRNIIGTLIEIGQGRIQKGKLKKILSSKLRRNAGPTAPAQGLCLLKVKY